MAVVAMCLVCLFTATGVSGEQLAPPGGAFGALRRAGSQLPTAARAAEPTRDPWPSASAIAVVSKPTVAYARPRGTAVEIVQPTTEFGSPTRLAVDRTWAGWVRVIPVALGNQTRVWIPRAEVLLTRTRVSVVIDLSAHRLIARRGRRILLRAQAGVGSPSSPTPIGVFGVTDDLDGAAFSPVYGPRIVALTGVQPQPPARWTGGVRLAVHGTEDPASVGANESSGCVRLSDQAIIELSSIATPGTTVVIQE